MIEILGYRELRRHGGLQLRPDSTYPVPLHPVALLAIPLLLLQVAFMVGGSLRKVNAVVDDIVAFAE